MSGSRAAGIEPVLHRMFERRGVDTLATHLEANLAIPVAKMSQLDVGVFRVDRRDSRSPLVARLFSAARPFAAAKADLAVLDYLAEIGFPAERPFVGGALSSHDGQPLLLTEFVKEASKAKRPPYPILTMGALIGRLHGLPVPAGADRPAGALHHFAEGTMSDELRAVIGWLDDLGTQAPNSDGVDTIRQAVLAADGGDGLPEAFVHPDPVPKNVIFTGDGPVLVDWTSAGRGSRVASLTLVLRSGWAAVPFMKGYTKMVSLTEDEWERLGELLFSRRLIDGAFRVCRDPKQAPTTAKKLVAWRRECEEKAGELRKLRI
jgi:Ser/Thr protein kinase RdoA (MazF antagonist)